MRICYSLLERTRDGYRWTWRAEGLRDSLLDDFLYRIQLPSDASIIRDEDLQGGILKFAQVSGETVDYRVVFYRFFDGGNDENGRVRVTMLAAWTTTDQFISQFFDSSGALEIFQSRTFKYVADNARTIGIEPPYKMINDEPLSSSGNVPSTALVEFLHGLNDEDHDCSLMICNDSHTFRKSHSVVFKHRESEATNIQRFQVQPNSAQFVKGLHELNRGGYQSRRLGVYASLVEILKKCKPDLTTGKWLLMLLLLIILLLKLRLNDLHWLPLYFSYPVQS